MLECSLRYFFPVQLIYKLINKQKHYAMTRKSGVPAINLKHLICNLSIHFYL